MERNILGVLMVLAMLCACTPQSQQSEAVEELKSPVTECLAWRTFRSLSWQEL